MSGRDRELPLVRTESRQDYQAMIDYIKDQIGNGREYMNDLVRVVLSDRGCYYEFRDMPEEFSGAVGSGFRYEFIGTQTSKKLLEAVHNLVLAPESLDTREISLMMIYGWDGLFRREDMFIYHWSRDGGDEEGPVMLGAYRPGVMPLFFKLKVESRLAEPLLGTNKGVLFFVANLSDQHLLVRIPHQGPGVTDLNETPGPRVVH
ncbi:MAG: hypothetical protein ABSD48_11690 [Armatimonadota bacterium]|jgi:hypothetical protein